MGLLEKKKDYKQRANDYHRKQDRIRAMQQKAAMKNPDEFYFGMNSSKVKDGKHRSNEDYRELDPEMVRVMKDQDLSFVRMQQLKDAKKAEKLQASLHLLDSEADQITAKRKHTIFVESKKEAQNFDVAEHFDTVPEFAGRSFNRLRKGDIEKMTSVGGDDDDDNEHHMTVEQLKQQAKMERKLAKKLAKARSNAYEELEARRKRARAMKRAEDHLVTEKLVAGKGRKRKIKAAEGGQPAQYKWRRKRLG